jgi:integrase
MDISTLVERINEAEKITPSRLKDLRSAARIYARLLGSTNPKLCLESTYALPKPQRDTLIADALPDASAIKVRNLKNNISFLLRQAEELNLVRIQQAGPIRHPVTVLKARDVMPSVLLPGREYNFKPFRLHFDKWQEGLRQDYEKWEQWASNAFVPGRASTLRLNPASVRIRLDFFEGLFGYLKDVRGIEQLNFSMTANPELVSEYASWHINERHAGRVTRAAVMGIKNALAMARHYFKDAEAAMQIADLRSQLGPSEAVIDKKSRMVSVADLISVAISEFPKKNQWRHDRQGVPKTAATKLANRAGRAVAIMLMATRPLRSKNWRECEIGKNILKDKRGKWVLSFAGGADASSLKRRTRNGAVNVYQCDVPDFIVPYLEEYIEFWRPVITQDAAKKHLLVTSEGNIYTAVMFTKWIQRASLKWLGKRVNPHLFRDIVASEIINETGDYVAAATLLNDEPATVFKHYWHLHQQKAAQVADDWLAKKMGATTTSQTI